MLSFLLIIVLSYLLGSIPTSIWVGKLFKGVDIREHGSGNAGATNTFRILGWKAGVAVSLIDVAKGFTAAYYISQIGYLTGGVLPEIVILGVTWETDVFMRLIAGAAAVGGHMYPLYAKFQGGKGVITAAGMLYGIEPISITLAILVFVIVLFSTRYVSLGSILACFSYPLFLLMLRFWFGFDIDGSLIVISATVAASIIIKHHSNIKRLIQGNENRIRSFKPAKGRLNQEQTT
ncbi:glycerol-3-phosphate 1-O-acyltransferase PlsY [Natronogracilivirga saccharolytica]|uniref:Glycerol-3-phosphate acyltransferase n=1 Tax=Natronogracilivirga saccharolytica TaxID=2812953 RepID=A0A8J7RPW6_9BACT|nr:glycerol-3-phosphate 1-O-acyltransferase PlsY [Natronogracilivirga saccharolytica]MBP3191714.1 glycerol-3-phosphate 1-O-acyltransferase PlsY [Natronogracilivirga saccharolytica]